MKFEQEEAEAESETEEQLQKKPLEIDTYITQ